ncbi:MAG: nucleoside triphosphate pyrophosphatase [Alphaproteobacteria bacterium]
MANPSHRPDRHDIVLASASVVRARILNDAGVACRVDPANVDESGIKADCAREGVAVETVVQRLAQAKAVAGSKRHPGCLVIGADQILECDGRRFDKPASLIEARTQLLALRGRTHRLVTAAALVRDGAPVWQAVDDAWLEMRHFTDSFLDGYLRAVGGQALQSVGAYQVEGLGSQLFARMTGDHFTILGLPLLPLLDALRIQGVLAS